MESQGLFETITDSAVLLDKAGRIVNWNTGSASLFGYSKKEVLGRSINLIYDRNYPFPKLIQEMHSQQKKWQEDTIFIRKNGIKGYCKTILCPLPQHDDNKAMTLIIHHNITPYRQTEASLQTSHHKLNNQLVEYGASLASANKMLIDMASQIEQSERKLRESELRFHLLAENATDMISRHTPDGTCLYVSPASKTALDYEPDKLVGSNIFKILHNDDHVKIKKAFTRRRDLPMNKTIIFRIMRNGGEFRWFESNVRLIMDENNRHVNEIQLASRDVTDRILDKKARLRGQQLAHVFRLSSMEEMASGMAHEISQPLAAIVNYTRGCVRHLENVEYDREQLVRVMEKAVQQAERAGEIIQRLKNFFCKGQLVKTPCKINNIVRETTALIKHELTVSKTKIDFEFDKNVPVIFIDKIHIQQVLLNLIQNAIEAMTEARVKDKRVSIQVAVTPENVEIKISDSGPGFPKDLIHKVFMPFFTTKAHGRGMGLAICRSIIEAHGGQFTINPKTPLGNSWIRFTLPLSI